MSPSFICRNSKLCAYFALDFAGFCEDIYKDINIFFRSNLLTLIGYILINSFQNGIATVIAFGVIYKLSNSDVSLS